jgi:hypothetical protein
MLFFSQRYFVLLILTDGIISDMAQTKEAIVNVSITHAPLMLAHSTLIFFSLYIYRSYYAKRPVSLLLKVVS